MTTMAMNEPRMLDGRMDAAPDADYATFLRVRNGISNEALRAAGLPPAQELTYDAYLRAFGPKNPRDRDDLEHLRAAPIEPSPITPPPMAQPRVREEPREEPHVRQEPPEPPPLGRRLILDEAPDGTWRIVAGPDLALRVKPRQATRPVAKIIAMMMGIAVAFVAAATLNAVFLQTEPWRLASNPAPWPAIVAADTGDVPAAAELGMKDDGRPMAIETVAIETVAIETVPKDLQIETASGGGEASAAESAKAVSPLPEVSVSTRAAQPVPVPAIPPGPAFPPGPAPMPQKTKPIDLPRSTPTATQLRLPSSTKPASTP